jgi:hypothetical protein
VPADDHEGVRSRAAHARDEREHVVHLERVHTGDTIHSRAVTLEVVLDLSREPEIGDVDAVPTRLVPFQLSSSQSGLIHCEALRKA